ncbi:acetyltransferase [Alkalihalobacillus sp. BA299]|uniref:acetyltransferase n=1 Tax=Alkalihalobacillus sp. BA299 TaxID=2815938 RepID=UPI001ADC6F74|nr:acetyltransferase [Alkalihalobacillus sp. BA299]
MRNKLIIIGASGHGKVAADIATKMNKWSTIAFLDDNSNIKTSLGIEIIGKSADAFKFINDCDLFVAIGNNSIRKKVYEDLESKGASIATLIHPDSIIGQQVEICSGTVVMPGAIINCCTHIGKGCIINTGVTIDHDNIIEDYVHLSPGVHLAGNVIIGKHSWLGVGSAVINNITINNCSIIGAGAVVINNITSSGTYVGVPAINIHSRRN